MSFIQITDRRPSIPSKLTRERTAVLADLKRKKGAMSKRAVHG